MKGFIEQLRNNLKSSTPSPHQSIYSEKGHGTLLYQRQMFTTSGKSFEQPQCAVLQQTQTVIVWG